MKDNSGSESWAALDAEERRVRAALGWVARLRARDVACLAQGVGGDIGTWWREGAPLEIESAASLRAAARERIETLDVGPDEVMETMAGWSGTTVFRGGSGYPLGLESLSDPPLYLRVAGRVDALRERAVAVVGSRGLRPRDTAVSRSLVEGICALGYGVVSGGALGADALAHEVALQQGAATVVVLPGCLEEPTPRSHAVLFERVIEAGGALVSEYEPGQSVRSYHFARRNELIAAIAGAVLVLRSARKGGTMLTVEAAEKIGRPIAAVPGDPDDDKCRGCFDAIVRGARLVADVEDLRIWLGVERGVRTIDAPRPQGRRDVSGQAVLPRLAPLPDALSDEARALYEGARALADDLASVSIDALASAMEWPMPRVLGAMLELELAGALSKQAGAERLRLLCA